VHLRVMYTAVIIAMALAGCAKAVTGVVIEKHDARSGVPQVFNCAKTEWLLVIDQGERTKASDRFKKKCVSFAVATQYEIGKKYP